ncbi:inositol polyphosphate 5-phosphatase, partial [Kappamyces sp. JEL0680]
SLAFVTAHFAAGQSAIEERNRDYWTITDGLSFRGSKLADTDIVFFFGDFNYRINMENSFARHKIKVKDYSDLWTNDQLTLERRRGNVFAGYNEGSLSFDPTYKYDNGSISYDTSEKQRVPAWTDRVMYKGSTVQLLEYARGEQVMSDHRPVKAFFSVGVYLFNREAKARIESSARSSENTAPVHLRSVSSGAAVKLPPPSTDQIRWWDTHPPRDIPVPKGDNPFFELAAASTGPASPPARPSPQKVAPPPVSCIDPFAKSPSMSKAKAKKTADPIMDPKIVEKYTQLRNRYTNSCALYAGLPLGPVSKKLDEAILTGQELKGLLLVSITL